MKLFFILLTFSAILFAESNLDIGYANSSNNSNKNENYTIGLGSNFKIDNINEEITVKKVYGSVNNKLNTDYIKIKSLSKYYINNDNDIYFKLKYFGDNIGTIKDQYIEVVGHNYTYKTKNLSFGTKLGVGTIQQTNLTSSLTDAGFILNYKITDITNFKIDYDYIKFTNGKSVDYEIGLYNNISNSLNLAFVYDNTINDGVNSQNVYKMTGIKFNYKF